MTGFPSGNALFAGRGAKCHISRGGTVYKRGMEPQFDIPPGRRVMPLWRICLIMGLTALLLLLLSSRFDDVVSLLSQPVAA